MSMVIIIEIVLELLMTYFFTGAEDLSRPWNFCENEQHRHVETLFLIVKLFTRILNREMMNLSQQSELQWYRCRIQKRCAPITACYWLILLIREISVRAGKRSKIECCGPHNSFDTEYNNYDFQPCVRLHTAESHNEPNSVKTVTPRLCVCALGVVKDNTKLL